MSGTKTNSSPLLARRTARKWSQAELARRAGISRTAVSAIEGRRLTPSVTAALSLAAALECSVEELFGRGEGAAPHEAEWAWTPRTQAHPGTLFSLSSPEGGARPAGSTYVVPFEGRGEEVNDLQTRFPSPQPSPRSGGERELLAVSRCVPLTEACRYWEAEVNGRRWLYPVEAVSLNPVSHDGVWEGGVCRESSPVPADRTLSLTCCDPAAGLLAAEYARATNFRLLIFPRNGRVALDLVRRGLVHVAGLHRSTAEKPGGNAESVRAALGGNYRLLRAAQWEEGVALSANDRTRSAEAVARHPRRWAARETGSAARECLDELLGGRRFSGREVDGHPAVAEAVRAGWAEAGVCVRFSAAEAGLNFLPMRQEALDFCFAAASQHDPRIQALIRLLRSRAYRRMVSELPGYDARQTGEMMTV